MRTPIDLRRADMRARIATIAWLLIAPAILAIAACSSESGAGMPTYKHNTKPSRVFALAVRIDNAPGPFASLHGTMQYDIANSACLPPADFFSGVQTTPISTFLPISLKRTGEGRYEGEIALDGLVDDDYFGRGVCRFKAVGPSVSLRATGAAGETRFVVRLDAEAVEAEATKTKYYWRGGYPRDPRVEDFPDHGLDSPDDFLEPLRDELFSVTIQSSKVNP